MIVDYHCHVLPRIDDGAKDVETSLQMLALLKKQGVARVVATPHFYPHRERSVDEFLERRQRAKEAILEQKQDIPELLLGAEVAIEHGLSMIDGIERLVMEGTNQILLEYPYSGFAPWMPEEVYNLTTTYRLQPILAHVHRYLDNYEKAALQQILQTEDAIFQINNEAMEHFRSRQFVKKLIKSGKTVIYGSDAHNMGERRPNF